MMKIQDDIAPRGFFYIEIRDEYKNLIDTYSSHNLVVNGGRALLAHTLVGSDIDNKKITKFGVGDSTAESNTSMIDLQGASFKNNILSFEFPIYNQVKINFEVGLSDANGINIKEFGLFSFDGTMFNRVVWNKNILKSGSFSFSGYFLISF